MIIAQLLLYAMLFLYLLIYLDLSIGDIIIITVVAMTISAISYVRGKHEE